MKRQYTMAQYRTDVAKLWRPKSDAPSERDSLAETLAEGEPRETAIQSQPPPPQGGLVRRWSGLRQRVRASEPVAAKPKQRQR